MDLLLEQIRSRYILNSKPLETIENFLFLRRALFTREISILLAANSLRSTHTKNLEWLAMEGWNFRIFERSAQNLLTCSAICEECLRLGFPDGVINLTIWLIVLFFGWLGELFSTEQHEFFTNMLAKLVRPLLFKREVWSSQLEHISTPNIFVLFELLFIDRFILFLNRFMISILLNRNRGNADDQEEYEDEILEEFNETFIDVKHNFLSTVRMRSGFFKKPLTEAVFHPDRVEKWLEIGGHGLIEMML
jgi:hypothetical protein